LRRPAHRVAGALLLALLAGACASSPELDERHAPTRSVLETVAVLRQHVPDDTYRFSPALDFTGRNIYRASLLRLENLEQAHADTLRAGTLDDVIAFAKGRSLERLRAFDLAAAAYRRAALRDGELEAAALRSAGALEDALLVLDTQRVALEGLFPEVSGTHYAFILQEELERSELLRARLLTSARRLSPDGDVLALGALQQLVTHHRESKNTNSHLLILADLYADMARDYVDENPPESLTFDPPLFEELVEAAARIYEAISNQDGSTEKLEAARRLEAFLAFTLRVDRDRFSP
jgi:hypothetical protein